MQQIYGIASKRTCTLVDHGQKEVSYICTYEQCDQNSRWVCAQCILMKFHNHHYQDQAYLKDQKQFVAYLEQKKSDIQNNNQKLSKNILELIEQLKKLVAELNNCKNFLQIKNNNNGLSQINDVISKVKQDLFQLQNDEVNLAIQTKYNPNEINEYLQLNLFVKQCRSRFETFQRRNQTSQHTRDVRYDRGYIKLESQIKQPQEMGQQNKQQLQNNQERGRVINSQLEPKDQIFDARMRSPLSATSALNKSQQNTPFVYNQNQKQSYSSVPQKPQLNIKITLL